MKTTEKLPKGYQNNPFFVATDGLELLFTKAKSIAVALAIVCALGLVGSLPSYRSQPAPAPESTSANTTAQSTTVSSSQASIPIELIVGIVVIAFMVLLVFMFIGIVISGTSDYASAQLARGKTVHLKDALRGFFANFWSYTWMMVIMSVKVLLWSLLLIVPGFVMAFRYSLAGVLFFDKNLRGNAAIKASAEMTKGLWLTTFASHTLLNFITFLQIVPLTTPGTNAVLYRQFVGLKARPKAHVLAWLTLVLPFVFLLFIGLAVGLLVWIVMNFMHTAP